jgi:proline dehydrogenase
VGPQGLSCTIPGRWRRSLLDAERAIEMGLRIRLVKGEWPDSQRPEVDFREGCLRLVDRLAGRAHSIAVATHDSVLASQALARLQRAGTPCEQELLFGLPVEPTASVARQAEVRTRLYVPYGRAWLPYSVGKVYENPRILFWILKDLLIKRSV